MTFIIRMSNNYNIITNIKKLKLITKTSNNSTNSNTNINDITL